MTVKKNVKTNSKQVSKQKKRKINPITLRPLRRVSALKTRRKKRLIKKRTYPARSNQHIRRKNRKKIQFRRQFNLPGNSYPVLVSSSDLMRGVNFAFKGKSYKLTLRQMMKLLRRRNLLKKRKTKPKFHQKYLRKKVSLKSSASLAKREKKRLWVDGLICLCNKHIHLTFIFLLPHPQTYMVFDWEIFNIWVAKIEFVCWGEMQ